MLLNTYENEGENPPYKYQDAQQRTPFYIANENANSRATLENSVLVSYKDKHILTICRAIPLLGIYPKEIKTNVHKINK